MAFRALYESSKLVSGWSSAKYAGSHAATKQQARTSKILLPPSGWVSSFVCVKDGNTGGVNHMAFDERPYLVRPYDTASRKVLYMTSRQTEKCVVITAPVLLANGSTVPAGEIEVGQRVATLGPDEKMDIGPVTWVSPRRQKRCVRITTRQGHVVEVAGTHPIRTWESWTEARALAVGDRIATVRKAGRFGTASVPEDRLRLTAYLIGDGGLTQPAITFTQVEGPVLDEVRGALTNIGANWREYQYSRAKQLAFNKNEILEAWLREDDLRWRSSLCKELPHWVFDLNKTDCARFLNRLWATDGHVSLRKSEYSIVYASISEHLVRQVQALLWKFGIPTRVRVNWPSVYKRRGQRKFAYLLRVETQPGAHAFLTQIGALGKSEGVPLLEVKSGSNRDTLPKAGAQDLLSRILNGEGIGRRSLLFAEGLPRKLSYAPTRERVQEYVRVLRGDPRTDPALVDRLEEHAASDVFWDGIVKIEDLGVRECVDFEIQDTHNFIVGGAVTHNSTTLGNKLLQLTGMRNNYVSLFVSPSAMQTKVFSVTRLDDIIDISPAIKALKDKSLVFNLLEKEFVNGSKIYLRYAFLSADRIRGLSVNSLFIDEIQDILTELLPVIEETTSHHKNPFFLYSGTPKTFDNTIEKIWSKSSTQSEWAIPCDNHTPRHWNILGIKHLGKLGPICERCGKLINPEHRQAQWVRGVEKAEFEGFRIPRLMVPWFVQDPEKWAMILDTYKRYPIAQFMNEVMALSYDSGAKPITRAELIRISDDEYPNVESELDKYLDRAALYAGIDWGGGSENSFTVLTVGGYVRPDSRFQILFSKRYSGHLMDPEPQLEDIERIIRQYKIRRVGVDFGGGFYPNKRLSSVFGGRRVHQFQYAGRAPAKFMYRGQLNRFIVFRSPVIADIFSAMKFGKIMLPKYETYENPHIDDILSIRSEYNNTLRMLQYDKPSGIPDDTFHSILYTILASYIDVRRPDIVSPILDPTISQTAQDAQAELNAMREMEDLAISADMR